MTQGKYPLINRIWSCDSNTYTGLGGCCLLPGFGFRKYINEDVCVHLQGCISAFVHVPGVECLH